MKHASYSFFSNFANKTRFQIIMSLKERPLCVNEIAEKIGEEQSKVSHNLTKLTACNILEVRRMGKQRIYSLNEKTVVPLLKTVDEHIKNNCKSCKCYK